MGEIVEETEVTGQVWKWTNLVFKILVVLFGEPVAH